MTSPYSENVFPILIYKQSYQNVSLIALTSVL